MPHGKELLFTLVGVLCGAGIGIIASAYEPELTRFIRGISGYVKVADYRVSVIGDMLTSRAHGIEYLKINSNKKFGDNFTLHLEYRVEGFANNVHDKIPLIVEKSYRYSWRGNSYILRVEGVSEELDGADLAIYQSVIEIGD